MYPINNNLYLTIKSLIILSILIDNYYQKNYQKTIKSCKLSNSMNLGQVKKKNISIKYFNLRKSFSLFIRKNISIKIFNRRKSLGMIFFDKLYDAFILNKINAPNFIKEFDDKGYAKVDIDAKNEIDIIINNLNNSNFNDKHKINDKYKIEFLIDENIKNLLNKILNNSLKNTMSYFEKYFNAKISPAYIMLKRHYHYERENISDEIFNNNFHNDAYALTHFKAFINLKDVSKNDGPLEIVSKNNTNKFIKKIKYKDRNDYQNNINVDEFIYKNTGKKYDCFFFDPTQCMHRATIPNKDHFRDVIAITFVCLPNKLKIKQTLLNKLDIFKYKPNPLLKYAKLTGIYGSIKTFLNYL